MSGAVGSRPSLIRSGTPVASERASFCTHSLSGMSSLDRRSDCASAPRTDSVTGYWALAAPGSGIEADITGSYGNRASDGRYTGAASYEPVGWCPTRERTCATILVVPRLRRSTEVHACAAPPNRAPRSVQIEIVGIRACRLGVHLGAYRKLRFPP